MSKFITLQNLSDEETCIKGIYLFQELGLDKVDFDLINEVEILKNYFNDIIWLIQNFKLTMTICNPSKKCQYQNGNLIKTKDSTGSWETNEYDANGNLIRFEDSNNYWEKDEYDKNGNLIKFKNSNGYWEVHEYDKNGRKIKSESSGTFFSKQEYDNNGNLISVSCSKISNFDLQRLKDFKAIIDQ